MMRLVRGGRAEYKLGLYVYGCVGGLGMGKERWD